MNEQKKLDAQEQAQLDGERLGFLIASLPVDQKTKEDLINSLSVLSEVELRALLGNLETIYLQNKTKSLDAQLKKDLESAQANYDQKIDSARDRALSAMDDLEKDLDAQAK